MPEADQPEPDQAGTGAPAAGRPRRWARAFDVVGLVLVALLAVVLRFVVRSPLWLDESLSVNIARLPLGDLTDALRQDGHPPLYYVLLHGWMSLFGEGDVAVRSLSGVFGLALLPLVWVAGGRLAGRRGALAALLVVALSPYAIRYSTETRMYSMVMVLALAAWLVADDALEDATWPRLAGLTLLTGALLWTHYWAMWFLMAAGGALVVHRWRAGRAGQASEVRRTTKVIASLAAGGLLFLPWVPHLLYQSANTGTPWAKPVRPTDMLARSVIDLAGGLPGEALLLALTISTMLVLAVFGRTIDDRRIELDLATRPEARPMLIVIGATMAIASVVGYATGATFATRYLAVVAPLILAVAGLGLSRFSGHWVFRLVAAALLLLGLSGGVRNVVTDRSQSREVASAIEAEPASGQLVITCPDQLGPSLWRELPGDVEIVTYPDFAAPELVNWVDYQERIDAADPEAFAAAALERAGERTIWYAWAGTYTTHEGTCERLLNAMLGQRPWATNPVVDGGVEYYEHEALWRLPATEGG